MLIATVSNLCSELCPPQLALAFERSTRQPSAGGKQPGLDELPLTRGIKSCERLAARVISKATDIDRSDGSQGIVPVRIFKQVPRGLYC